MSIIFICHPETEWDVQGRFQGTLEGPITDSGLEQAAQFVSSFPHIQIHHIYYGPNKRTRVLAELLLRRYPVAGMYIEPRLQERSYGEYEGMLMKEVSRYEHYDPDNLLERYVWTPPNGESYQEVSARANEFVLELQQVHPADEVVVCITSSGVMRNVVHVQQGLSLADIFVLHVQPLQTFEVQH